MRIGPQGMHLQEDLWPVTLLNEASQIAELLRNIIPELSQSAGHSLLGQSQPWIEFSVAHCAPLYDSYAPKVQKLEAEVTLAVNVTNMSQAAVGAPLAHDPSMISHLAEEIVHTVDGKRLTLNELAKLFIAPSSTLVEAILLLNRRSEVGITIEKLLPPSSQTPKPTG